MGDSDDEYDRKRRDKFRGERSSGDNYRSDRRGGEERGRGREDWNDRGRNRPDYREYRGRERFSPERGPPMKRMRDWGEEGHDNFGGYNGGGGGGPGWGVHDHYSLHNVHAFPAGVGHIQPGIHNRIGQETQNNSDVQTQPSMLTLKQFLASQDDSISDSDAITKYSEYKLEFKKQQLNEFFVTHKDEEWFKSKYHPVDSKIKNDGQMQFLNKRKDTFLFLLENSEITNVTVDTTQSEALLKLLDTTVIYLEGGNQDDVKMLSEKVKPIEFINKSPKPELDTRSIGAIKHEDDICLHPKPYVTEENWDDDDEEPTNNNNTENNAVVKQQPGISGNDEENTNNQTVNEIEESKGNPENKSEGDMSENMDTFGQQNQIKNKNKASRKKTNSESSNSTSSSTSDVETGVTEDNGNQEGNKKNNNDNEANMKNEANVENDKEAGKQLDDEDEHADTKESETINNDTVEAIEVQTKADQKSLTIDLDQDECSVVIEKNTPRELHRTSSIFLRNLAPSITKAEIETLCKRYNGYLRVAIADPLVERRWFRRGWVTFKRDTNIKEICWNLNNIRLRDCELGAIVNRDLSRRVRPVNGITTHKTIVRNDIKLCAKIAHNLDTISGIWSTTNNASGSANDNNQANDECQSFGLHSRNPVLQNITDYLIEEASAEEDELLGLSGNDNKDTDGEFLERDVELISVLDKLILYLRIVHSVDFYNHCEYPYEDEMPNRCGIIHARGPPPQNKIQSNEIQDYIRTFEGKLTTFLIRNETLDDAEMKKIGAKDVDVEIEKFVQANTQELAKDKWLCPLSGKKFKGPEFIKKHIFNKHGEKVDEVKKEVEYFNAYLKDPKRPTLPEHPGNNRKLPNEISTVQQPGYRPYQGPGYMGPPYGGYAPQMMMPSRPRGGGGVRRGNSGEYRPIIHYRDLDAPREPEDFL